MLLPEESALLVLRPGDSVLLGESVLANVDIVLRCTIALSSPVLTFHSE